MYPNNGEVKKEIEIPLIQEVNNFFPNKEPTYKGKKRKIIDLLSDVSELFYKNEGSPITSRDLVLKSYGFEKAEKFYDKIINPYLKKPKLLQHIELNNGIYPLALYLKIRNGDPDGYDLTLIDGFDDKFETFSEKIIINFCINHIKLNDFLKLYPNKDRKIVLKSLIKIAKSYDTKYSSLATLKDDVDLLLEENRNFCHLIYVRNKYFVPRELELENGNGNPMEIFKAIDEIFSYDENQSEPIVVLSGFGGAGKSQIANQYAYKHSDENTIEIICWINAKDSKSVRYAYSELNSYLNPDAKEINDDNTLIKNVKNSLSEKENWLLIFDDVDEMEDIGMFLPRTRLGRILVTSQNSNWPNVREVIKVTEFSPSESEKYILKSLSIDETNRKIVNDLAEKLKNLPLALSQACAYIKATGMQISDYIATFEKENINVFKEVNGRSSYKDYPNYPCTVATTWSISIKKLRKLYPDAIYILKLCAFLAPNDIPIKLIKNIPKNLHEEDSELLFTDFQMNNAISSLREYSLVQRKNEMISVHGLVQLVTRHSITDKSMWICLLVKAICAILPPDTKSKEDRDIYYHLLPHLSNIIKLAEENSIQYKNISEDIISVISKFGTFLYNTSDFKKDLEYQAKSLEICRKIGDQIGEARCLSKIGNDYNRLGEYKKDEEYQNKSLEICERIDNPNYQIDRYTVEAECYINLGKACHNLCQFKDAIIFYNKSLEKYKELKCQQGEANCYINIGVSYYRLGNFIKDIEYQGKSLKMCRKIGDIYGVSKCYTNLSNAYLSLGNIKKAIKLQNKSLEICELIGDRQGESTCNNNLGVICHYHNSYEKAIDKLLKSIKINNEIGDIEGNTKCYGNLGNVYHSLEDYEKANDYQKESRKICKMIRDKQGLSTVYYNFGNICHSQNEFYRAIEYLEDSLKICQANADIFGELKCHTSLIKAYKSIGDSEREKEFDEKRQKINREISKLNNEEKCHIAPGDVYNRLS